MLKKHFGGLTLLVFTFTFAVPLLVGVNILDAGPTQIFRQPWKTDFYCPDGTYATSSSGTHVNEYYHGHPEKECKWVVIGGGDNNPNNDVWRWVCVHKDGHNTNHYYSES